MFYDLILKIDHKSPIPSTIYCDLISLLETESRRAYGSYLENLKISADPKHAEFYDYAISIFEEDNCAWFWIEKTEPGSGKAIGKGRHPALVALYAAMALFAADVAPDTMIWKDSKAKTIEVADAGYDYLKELFSTEHKDFTLMCTKENGTILITAKIHPFVEEKYHVERKRVDDIEQG